MSPILSPTVRASSLSEDHSVDFCSGLRIGLRFGKRLRVSVDGELEDFVSILWRAHVDALEYRASGVFLSLDQYLLIESGRS